MTSDEDIYSWVEQNYRPHILTPEEFVKLHDFGSPEREKIALEAAQEIYERYLEELEEKRVEEEVEEELEEKRVEEEVEEEEEEKRVEEEVEEEEEAQKPFYQLIIDFIKKMFE